MRVSCSGCARLSRRVAAPGVDAPGSGFADRFAAAVDAHRFVLVEAGEAGERRDRRAVGDEPVFRRIGVGVPERHRADHALVGRERQLALDHAVELQERRLRAGVEAAGARRDHHVLQEHPVVEPASPLEIAVDREDQPDRRVEEEVVAPVLAVHAGLVAAVDAEEPVQVPADPAPSPEIGLVPFDRIVAVLLRVRVLLVAVRAQDRVRERLPALAGQDVNMPRLGVGAAGRAARHGQDLLDRRARHRGGQERAHRAPRRDRAVHRRDVVDRRGRRHAEAAAASGCRRVSDDGVDDGRDAFPARRRGLQHLDRRRPGAPQPEHFLEIAHGDLGRRQVALAHDQDVGDLEDAGLDRLHVVAESGRTDDEPRVGELARSRLRTARRRPSRR